MEVRFCGIAVLHQPPGNGEFGPDLGHSGWKLKIFTGMSELRPNPEVQKIVLKVRNVLKVAVPGPDSGRRFSTQKRPSRTSVIVNSPAYSSFSSTLSVMAKLRGARSFVDAPFCVTGRAI